MSTQIISRDEWLSALKDAGLHDDSDPNAVTSTEFAALMGMSRSTAERKLKLLVKAGGATAVHKRITDTAGRSVQCSAYRLLTRTAKRK